MKTQKSFGRFLTALTLSVAMLASAVSPALAANTSNTHVHQEKPYWCWAACSVSMLECAGYYVIVTPGIKLPTVSQTQFSQTLYNNTFDIPRPPADVCNGFRTKYSLPTYFQSSPMSSYNIEHYSDIDSPIFACIEWAGGGAHAVLISGYVTSGNTLRVMDPADIAFTTVPLSTFTTNYANAYSGTSGGMWTQSFYYTV